MTVPLELAALAEQMEYGTVVRWLKRPGDTVTRGEVILEVEAEKANFEIESPVDGVLAEIVAEEGDELPVGALLATLEEA